MAGLGDRYYVRKLTSADGSKVSYAIEDIAEQEFIRDERRNPGTGKRRRHQYWQGTESDANHYCYLLNKALAEKGERQATMLDNLSQSQRIHHKVNAERKRATPNQRVRTVASGAVHTQAMAFRRCPDCRRMTKEDHSCPSE